MPRPRGVLPPIHPVAKKCDWTEADSPHYFAADAGCPSPEAERFTRATNASAQGRARERSGRRHDFGRTRAMIVADRE